MLLLRLRLRAWLGWGQHRDGLHEAGGYFIRGFVLVNVIPALLVVIPTSALHIVALIKSRPYHGIIDASPLTLLVVVACWLAFLSPLWLSGASFLLLSRKAHDAQRIIIQGRCFAVLPDAPARCYARIGAAAESARWYLLPAEWDALVIPSDVTYELEVDSVTGWVARLRSLGMPPFELRQEEPHLRTREEAREATQNGEERPAKEDIEPPARGDERHALKRQLRAHGRGWGASSACLAAGVYFYIPFGIMVGIITPALLVAVIAVPLVQMNTNTAEDLLVCIPFALFFGVPTLLWGIYMIGPWRRDRRAAREPIAQVEGAVADWHDYRDAYSGREETLIAVDFIAQPTLVVRISKKYSDRVRHRGAHLRITYRPRSGRVLTVARLDAPELAQALATPQRDGGDL